jgi:hypothetical protein
MRSRCKLLLRLGGWLALAKLALGGRVEADEDVAPDWEPTPQRTAVERRLPSSREPTDSIVGMRLMTPPSIAIGSSEGTSSPNSSMDM